MDIARFHRTAGGVGLVAGVAAFGLGDLGRRLVEQGTRGTVDTTAAVDRHAQAWLAAGLLEVAGALLLVVGATTAARLVTTRGGPLTTIGGYLFGVGAVASMGHAVGYFGTFASYAGSGLPNDALTRLGATDDVLGGVVIALFMTGMLLGPVLLTIGLRRACVVPVAVPVLAVVFVVAGGVGGAAAGVVGLAAGLGSVGFVGVTVLRGAVVPEPEEAGAARTPRPALEA